MQLKAGHKQKEQGRYYRKEVESIIKAVFGGKRCHPDHRLPRMVTLEIRVKSEEASKPSETHFCHKLEFQSAARCDHGNKVIVIKM